MTGLGQGLALAAVYALVGRAALWLAVPPGYATAVWPSAGIALAAILIMGPRFAPAVMLGSILINIWTTLDVHSSASVAFSLALATSVGFGAALQALFGAFLIHRLVGFPNALASSSTVLRFLSLGGPVACTVGATWGVGTLLVCGVIPQGASLQNWATWWVGDTIGVLIFAPLTLIVAGEPRRVWRARWRSVAVPLFVTFILSVLVFTVTSAWESERIQREFDRRARTLNNALTTSFTDYINTLESIESFYESSQEVDRLEFARYVAHPLERYPGITAFSWNPHVTHEQREAFEQSVQAEGYPGFEIVETNARGENARAADRPHYTPILFIEPMEYSRVVLGFNVASDPVRLRALEIARDTGKPAATESISLIQDPNNKSGMLIYMPIYRPGQPRETLEQRRANLLGFAVGVFNIERMVTEPLRGLDHSGVDLYVYDETLTPHRLLFSEGAPLSDSAAYNPRDYEVTSRHEVAGRKWAVHFAPTLEFLATQSTWSGWTGPAACSSPACWAGSCSCFRATARSLKSA